jgi:hypothetical protein
VFVVRSRGGDGEPPAGHLPNGEGNLVACLLLGAMCLHIHDSVCHGVVGTLGAGPTGAPTGRHLDVVYAHLLEDLERAELPPLDHKMGVCAGSAGKIKAEADMWIVVGARKLGSLCCE